MKRRSSAIGVNERCASPIIKRTKVQAQRKFAQGSNNYATSPTKLPKPGDSSAQPFSPEANSVIEGDDRELNNFSNLPTIDDFLTFLCYRETDVLPQRLNYLNTPQFETIPVKKKPTKSNSTIPSTLPSSKSSIENKASDKVTSNFNDKKKVPEYKLRSKDLKCSKPIINKSSRSLALKHNQRLRKAVQAKFNENKLQNFKTKNSLKLSPPKNIVNSKANNIDHSIKLSTKKEPPKVIEQEVKRVTRRNSNLNVLVEKPDIVKPPSRKPQAKSNSPKELSVTVRNTQIPAKKLSSKSIRISVSKLPAPVTPTSPIKTRSTRSSTARLESIIKTPSTSSRPSRKTKEAAALYMETLGKDLLRGDESFDEDEDLSLESFFEFSSLEPAKPKKETKEKKPKPSSAKIKVQKLNKKLPKKPVKSDKVKRVVKKDKTQIEKLNNELKKIVEDKPLKEKLEHITKSVDVDKELETIDKILTKTEATKDQKNNHECESENESVDESRETDVRNDSVEITEQAIPPDKANKEMTSSKNRDNVEIAKLPKSRNENDNETEKVEKNVSNHQKEKKISNNSKNCLKKPAEKIEKPEISNVVNKNSTKKSTEKAEKSEISNTSNKNTSKKSTDKIEKPETPIVAAKNSSKKSAEKEEKSTEIVTAEKSIPPEIAPRSNQPVVKPNQSITSKNSSKKISEKVEKPETPNSISKNSAKKSTEKVENHDVPNAATKNISKKPSEKPEKTDEGIKKVNEQQNIDKDHESQKLKDLTLKTASKSKPVEKHNPDSNSDIEEVKSKRRRPSEPICKPTKKTPNRKKPTKPLEAKNKPEEESKKEVTNITIDEFDDESVGDLIIDEKSEDDEPKSIPELVFADVATTSEDSSEKSVMQGISNKMFCLESKKIIFKKNKSSSVVDEKEDSSPRKTEAFSADNENSVYAFEPDLPTTSPPFRRLKPVTPPKSLISGNSIAVQVNFESNTKIECSSSSETQVTSTTDCDDRVFYIPIQTSDTNSTLGVAVKLDTDGANQKIIMSATLVTKSPSFTTSTATTVASKPTILEPSTPEVTEKIEEIPKKVPPKENPDKVVATADSQTSQTPVDSPSSTVVSPKSSKKVSSTTKPSQSVKIVKINKISKTKKPIPAKSKPKPKPKSNKNKSSDDSKPAQSSSNEILEAPTFYPTEAEFNDPLKYIDTIRSVAEKFGLCRIVPPSTFRPECKVADEMRFTAYNQYVHKMLHRWGPNVKEMLAIKKFLATQNIQFTHPPWIGGMEVDLPRLYQIVQQCGGLKAVIEKERWHQVADVMKIPKLAQDRITKLDDIYCKYLLPYDILSHNEREKLFEEVEKDWKVHLKNPNDDDEVFDDIDECIVKGRTMPLSCFYRIARNTMMMCFGSTEGEKGPSTETIEKEFWNHVSERKSHICVHSGSIDTGVHGYGFSVAKNSTFRKHPWNLKVLTNNSASILRSLGPIMGVTVPTLHVGMLYSACCWYRDPHGLPWIEYLHTGANKIWYGIPDEHSEQFRKAMRILVPRNCRDKRLWLPSDTVMIPPPLLAAQNVPLSRVVQQPGQFIVVFPKAFTSCISTGYMVSESVYFAHTSWLNSAKQIFSDMQESCEPSVFSLEQLLISVATDVRASLLILGKILPLLIELRDTEVALRNQLAKLSLTASEKMKINKKRKSKASFSDEDNYECEICRANLFVSLVINSHEQTNYCLSHAVNLLQKKPAQVKYCKLMYAYTEEELEEIITKVRDKIETKRNRKPNTKQNSN